MKTTAFRFVAILWFFSVAAGTAPAQAPGLGQKIAALTAEMTPSLVALRRDIHAHPELSLQETRTSGLVAEEFRRLGLEVRTGVGKTGVLGVLRGGKPGPVVALRGDMDALPIVEETGLPFASGVKSQRGGVEVGVMHACGHDIHTAVLVGAARVLTALRRDLAGTVLFIAQPGEEAGDGARLMVEDGVFKDLKPEAFFALHVDDTVPAGVVKYVPGWAAANVDGFRLRVESEGGHGASPQLCVDPVVVGAQVVLGLQVMVARELDARRDTVVTVGAFHAGTASNIIPREARLDATVRTYGEDQRALVKEKIARLVKAACDGAGATFKLDYYYGTPALYNDPALMSRAVASARRVLGKVEAVVEDKPDMGGEDFSVFAALAPGVMLGLGVAPKPGPASPVHSPTFVADEDAIAIGVRLMASFAADYLAAPPKKSGANR